MCIRPHDTLPADHQRKHHPPKFAALIAYIATRSRLPMMPIFATDQTRKILTLSPYPDWSSDFRCMIAPIRFHLNEPIDSQVLRNGDLVWFY